MTATAPTQTAPLSLDGVWKRFPGVLALRDVSFSVRAGQHPALLPDLTVAENLALAVRRQYLEGRDSGWMREELERVGCGVTLETRVEELGVANRALIELAKALALRPRILILDEPTAALGADMVERVFDAVREAAARGGSAVPTRHAPHASPTCRPTGTTRVC